MARAPLRMYNARDFVKEHGRLHKQDSYMPRPQFLPSGTWGAKTEKGLKSLLHSDGFAVKHCSIAALVSRDNYYVSPTGDCNLVGNPPTPSIPLSNACFRFTLVEPRDSEHFKFIDDFKQCVKATKSLVDAMPPTDKPVTTAPFLTRSTTGDWCFNFEYSIFRAQSFYTGNATNEREPVHLNEYSVPKDYQPFLEKLKERYYGRRIRIWDGSTEGIEHEELEYFMKDSIVEVDFTLHYDSASGLKADISWVSILN